LLQSIKYQTQFEVTSREVRIILLGLTLVSQNSTYLQDSWARVSQFSWMRRLKIKTLAKLKKIIFLYFKICFRSMLN